MTSNANECVGSVFQAKEIQIKQVDFSYVKNWLKYSWKIAKENYGLIFGVGLIQVLPNILFAFYFKQTILESFYSDIFECLVSIVLVPGYIFIVKNLIEKKPVLFVNVFHVFKEKGLLLRLLPLIVFCILYGLADLFFTSFFISVNDNLIKIFDLNPVFIILMVLFQVLISILVYFVLPLMVVRKLDFSQAIFLNLKSIAKNFGPILVFVLTMVTLGFLSIFTAGIASVFFLKPMLVVQSYIVYATVFENLSPESRKVESV